MATVVVLGRHDQLEQHAGRAKLGRHHVPLELVIIERPTVAIATVLALVRPRCARRRRLHGICCGANCVVVVGRAVGGRPVGVPGHPGDHCVAAIDGKIGLGLGIRDLMTRISTNIRSQASVDIR